MKPHVSEVVVGDDTHDLVCQKGRGGGGGGGGEQRRTEKKSSVVLVNQKY